MMEENIIFTFDDTEKLVTDLLLYIEKETDIQFEYSTMGGISELISVESSNSASSSCICPAVVYDLQSYNYCVGFIIYVCECEGKLKIIEITLLPFDSKSDETFIKANEYLTEILPDIPITHHLRKSGNDLDEADYAILLEVKYDLNWNRAVWGTKWDAYHDSVSESGDTLTINYATAWSPNRDWVRVLCDYIDHMVGFDWGRTINQLSVEHRYSDYPGNFGGIVEWKPRDEFRYTHYDLYTEFLKAHDKEGYDMIMEAEARMRIEQQIQCINLPV